MNRCVTIATVFMLLSCSAYAAEEEWFQDAGTQPYSLEESEMALQKGERPGSPIIEKFPNGLIVDWKKGLIVVRGREFVTGKPTPQNRELIRKGAANNAKTKMVRLIDELRVDRSSRLADMLEKSYKLRTDIKNLIMSRAVVINEKYWPDEKVLESTVAINLFGKNGLAQDIYWHLFYWEDGWNKYYTVYEPPTSDAFTGLIIDARGIDIEPALLPRIVNEDEDLLYRDRYVKYDIFVKRGLVIYSDDINAAISDARVGPNPLVVKAVTTVKSSYGTDIILSQEDDIKLKDADKTGKFLKYLRVIIVL